MTYGYMQFQIKHGMTHLVTTGKFNLNTSNYILSSFVVQDIIML